MNCKFLIVFGLLLFMVSCALDANQEKSLNKAIVQYEHSYNNRLQLLEASLTHPCVIASLLKDGDSTFSKYFSHDDFELKNFKVGKVEMHQQNIQVAVTFEWYHVKFSKSKKKELLALSTNNGKHWFFADKKWIHALNCDRLTKDSKHAL